MKTAQKMRFSFAPCGIPGGAPQQQRHADPIARVKTPRFVAAAAAAAAAATSACHAGDRANQRTLFFVGLHLFFRFWRSGRRQRSSIAMCRLRKRQRCSPFSCQRCGLGSRRAAQEVIGMHAQGVARMW